MGVDRDLKKANEAYWAGKLSKEDLLAEGKRLRIEHWKIQQKAGIDIIPSNDFSFYDHVLDHIQLFEVGDVQELFFPTLTVTCRLFPRSIPANSWVISMSSLLWEEVSNVRQKTENQPLTCLLW